MKKISLYFVILAFHLIFIVSCKDEDVSKEIIIDETSPALGLSEEVLYDKVLGMMVGSAIGDAMGAPTEMWAREAIDLEYGWVSKLDSMVRETSPEGIWIPNLPAGGGTDDTRWKKLAYEYLANETGENLKPEQFARHILSTYEKYFESFGKLKPEEIQKLEVANLKVYWLSEWAKVSRTIVDNDLMAYQAALGKFYGGEMVCAGLLYSQAIGVYFPGQPEKAYQEAFKLSMFDLGYAKDISALSAAMTSAAMQKNARPNDILDVIRTVDPEGYFQSRLVGRSSYRILQQALSIVGKSKDIEVDSLLVPESKKPELNLDREMMQKAFSLLDESQQDMPFHAGEIHLQVLTAMIYCNFDFERTLIFLTNYGRDNDTTAAIAGAILGAYWGYEALPMKMKTQVLEVNQNLLDIDIESLSRQLATRIYANHQ